ncbi:MAG: hypothetical protein KJ927_20275 [Candidatus Eisenbacteria bacterium]|nr:hypothetical protein [Candidatus Eisenbacteria bacterium]MBU1951059.1 hypothetical protein [Candidatus Eisenbacteria bacterium]
MEILHSYSPRVEPGHVLDFLHPLPISDLWGVGRIGADLIKNADNEMPAHNLNPRIPVEASPVFLDTELG